MWRYLNGRLGVPLRARVDAHDDINKGRTFLIANNTIDVIFLTIKSNIVFT
jgi:hypothetical protein